MRIKMISYRAGYDKESQSFATFEYMQIKFDMFRNMYERPIKWNFIEDRAYDQLKKISNIEMIRKTCLKLLYQLDEIKVDNSQENKQCHYGF